MSIFVQLNLCNLATKLPEGKVIIQHDFYHDVAILFIFQNSTLSWDTEDPDLTRCFQKTVLIWIPCAFLWAFSALEVFYILHSKKRDIPWNFLNISKLILTGALIILSLTDIIMSVNSEETLYSVDIYTPIIKILTFVSTQFFCQQFNNQQLNFCFVFQSLSILLLMYNRKNGLQSSALLWLFWFLLLLCGIVQFRSEIREYHNQDGPATYSFISYCIYFGIIIAIFLFNCFADHTPRVSKHHEEKVRNMFKLMTYQKRSAVVEGNII